MSDQQIANTLMLVSTVSFIGFLMVSLIAIVHLNKKHKTKEHMTQAERIKALELLIDLYKATNSQNSEFSGLKEKIKELVKGL